MPKCPNAESKWVFQIISLYSEGVCVCVRVWSPPVVANEAQLLSSF